MRHILPCFALALFTSFLPVFFPCIFTIPLISFSATSVFHLIILYLIRCPLISFPAVFLCMYFFSLTSLYPYPLFGLLLSRQLLLLLSPSVSSLTCSFPVSCLLCLIPHLVTHPTPHVNLLVGLKVKVYWLCLVACLIPANYLVFLFLPPFLRGELPKFYSRGFCWVLSLVLCVPKLWPSVDGVFVCVFFCFSVCFIMCLCGGVCLSFSRAS